MKKQASATSFDIVRTMGLALPEVEAMTNWAGLPVLRARGCFMAGLASHRSAEPGTLVVRCAVDERERLVEDAPDTYYVMDYYRPYPVVLVRLSHLNRDALRDLLSVSWHMAMAKARGPCRSRGR
jgi:hypothetical protein